MREDLDSLQLPKSPGAGSVSPETRFRLSKPTVAEPDRRFAIASAPLARSSAVGGWKKLLFLFLAGLFFFLGLLGALLPGLPTTPFLLLTSYFLVRSSPRLNAALLRSRLFGPVLTDWQVHGGVRRDVRIKAIVMVVVVVALSIYLSGYSLLPSLMVSLLAALGITVILRLPHARPG